MRIAIAQIEADKGNIKNNIEIHKKWILTAVSENADLISFSELSLTGYEPELAKEMAADPNDVRLDVFQKISDLYKIVIAVGLPTRSESGVHISMIIFQPDQQRQIYSKQKLHSDELPYFIEGNEQIILSIKNRKIAPAICYESLQAEHSKIANSLGAEIYLASVAKSQNGIEKAFAHYPKIATMYSMPVLMSNSIGFCDNFQSAGQSAVWDKEGLLKGKLENNKEGLLIFDTETEEIFRK